MRTALAWRFFSSSLANLALARPSEAICLNVHTPGTRHTTNLDENLLLLLLQLLWGQLIVRNVD
jgi:hypothetical protein